MSPTNLFPNEIRLNSQKNDDASLTKTNVDESFNLVKQ